MLKIKKQVRKHLHDDDRTRHIFQCCYAQTSSSKSIENIEFLLVNHKQGDKVAFNAYQHPKHGGRDAASHQNLPFPCQPSRDE